LEEAVVHIIDVVGLGDEVLFQQAFGGRDNAFY
jgi:hypothetical protein